MSTLRWIIGAAGIVLAALFGMRSYYEKKLEEAEERHRRAADAAVAARDSAAAMDHLRRAAEARAEHQAARSLPVEERIRRSLREARRRLRESRD